MELKKSPSERYIQAIYSQPCKDGGPQIYIVVTMLPELIALVHQVHTTQHDMTYKRVFGEFNEWEVVIWDQYRNSSKYSECRLLYDI